MNGRCSEMMGSNGASVCGVRTPGCEARAYVAPVDVLEAGEAIVVIADVPGARAESVEVKFEENVLTIGAKVNPRVPREANELLGEYGVGDFGRSIRVSHPIDASKISAELKAGVLTVRLPLADSVRARKIAVQSA